MTYDMSEERAQRLAETWGWPVETVRDWLADMSEIKSRFGYALSTHLPTDTSAPNGEPAETYE